jgi:hypothetical protein
MVLNTQEAKVSTGEMMMRHPKLVSLAVMLAVFGCVGGIAWAVMNSHVHAEMPIKEQTSDTTSSMYREVPILNAIAQDREWGTTFIRVKDYFMQKPILFST